MEEDEILSTEKEVNEPSMEETIAAKLAEINARDTEPEPEEPAEETEEEKEARVRDEKGRFAKKEADPEAQAQADPEAAPAVGVPPELQRLGLRKEEAEALSQAPEAVRQAFIRRSEDMHRGLETYREKAQVGDRYMQSLQPYMPTIQALGVDPLEATQRLFNVDHTLRFGNEQQKLVMMHHIMKEYGINPDSVYSYQPPQVDPQVAQLYNQLHRLEGQQRLLLSQQQQREMETLNSEISRFSADKPHFEAVRNEMAALLQAGIATDLQSAYDQAIYANPTVRAQLLASQRAEQEQKRKAEAQAKAQEAKRASSVNVPRKGNFGAQKPVGTMEDTIREAAQKLGII